MAEDVHALEAVCANQAAALVYLRKAGAAALPSYDMHGKLFLSSSGWLLLHVSNQMVRGAFDALNVPGAELPLKDGQLRAHCSVMSPDEITSIGGPEKITERGHTVRYKLGELKSVTPSDW